MAKRMTREAVLAALRRQLDEGKPILAFGAGSGMTARCAEAGGADYISIYTTAFNRCDGLPSVLAWLPYGDVNEEMRTRATKILPLIRHTPCVAGLGVHDPRIDIPTLLDEFTAMGFSGVSNEPFCSMYGSEIQALLNREGLGIDRELELMTCAREQGLFTAAWVADAAEAARFADAGCDVVGVLAGLPALPIERHEDYMARVYRHLSDAVRAAKAARPQVIALVHGGPLNDVETCQRAIKESGADGCATGSGGERIPAEAAVTEITRRYKDMAL